MRFCIIFFWAFLLAQRTNAQIGKRIIYYDTVQFNSTIKSNLHDSLIDLRTNSDSIFIRFYAHASVSPTSTTYELKYSNKKWKARSIDWKYKVVPVNFSPNDLYIKDFGVFNLSPVNTWDSIQKILDEIDILKLKDQQEVDCVHNFFIKDGLYFFNLEDGLQYSIEISTPDTYKFIYWSNPEHAYVKSEEVIRVLKLINLMKNGFSLSDINSSKKYRSFKW